MEKTKIGFAALALLILAMSGVFALETNNSVSETQVNFSNGNSTSGLLPVYRFYNEKTGSHFFTISETERNKLLQNYSSVWTPEGIAFYAYTEQEVNTFPVYRFYDNHTGDHFFTISEIERNKLLQNYSSVWTPEGIAFYVFSSTAESESLVLNLRMMDKTKTSILWEWTNPSNISGLAVYLDGKSVANLSSNKSSYEAKLLEPNTEYTLAIYTINLGVQSKAGVFSTVKTDKESSSSSSVIVKKVAPEENPIVFTSSFSSQQPINLSATNVSASYSDPKSSSFYYIMIATLVILIIALIALIILYR